MEYAGTIGKQPYSRTYEGKPATYKDVRGLLLLKKEWNRVANIKRELYDNYSSDVYSLALQDKLYTATQGKEKEKDGRIFTYTLRTTGSIAK